MMKNIIKSTCPKDILSSQITTRNIIAMIFTKKGLVKNISFRGFCGAINLTDKTKDPTAAKNPKIYHEKAANLKGKKVKGDIRTAKNGRYRYAPIVELNSLAV